MADVFGNYTPIVSTGLNLNPTPTFGQLRQGAGVPANSLGNSGDLYLNISTGDLYQKSGNVRGLVTGGSGGTTQVLHGAGDDPNVAVVVPADPSKSALYSQDGTNVANLFRWDVPDQVWYPLISV